jgi:hypothetical protein
MADVLGIDFLTNPKIAESTPVNLDIGGLESVELPTFNLGAEEAPAPRLVPSLDSVGPMKTSDGLENLNAEQFLGPSHGSRRISEENVMKEKYEILRKFERLQKLGVPMRKRFTLDSPLEEMKMELDFIKREKDMDATIKQFCDWFITGMSALEWSSKNVAIMKAFGLQLDGLSESAQMNVGDMEDDFEELYDLYGEKMKMHPLVRIPIRTCMMVYMVHLTNQMARKAPIPNIDEVMRSNPDIARQLAQAAMQQQTQNMRSAPQSVPVMAPPPSANPLSGLASFMSGMVPPPPPQQMNTIRSPPASIKGPVKMPKPQIPTSIQRTTPKVPDVGPPPAPLREMKGPAVNIDELLKSVNANVSVDSKKVSMPPSAMKKGGSTGKNSVSIKL